MHSALLENVDVKDSVDVLPFYSQLEKEDKAVIFGASGCAKGARPRIILVTLHQRSEKTLIIVFQATNIARSSMTIPGLFPRNITFHLEISFSCFFQVSALSFAAAMKKCRTWTPTAPAS